MKHSLSITIFLFYILLTQFIVCTKNNLKSSSQNSSSSQIKNKSKTHNDFISDMSFRWISLFSEPRGNSCSLNLAEPDVADVEETEDEGPTQKNAWGKPSRSCKWIKKWGFEDSAYLIDYLDDVFLQDFIDECKIIIHDISIQPKTVDNYLDPLDMKLNTRGEPVDSVNIKKVNDKFDFEVWNNSINTVQLHQILKEFQYNIDKNSSDPSLDFVSKYDCDGDGRLNFRELIIGVIWQNRTNRNFCYDCFSILSKKISAIFTYIDCAGKGYISAEQMWNKLPNLKRSENAGYNIFTMKDKDLRTSTCNDFVLKNSRKFDGHVINSEFSTGILLAMAQRHVNILDVTTDDTIAMKKKRWA